MSIKMQFDQGAGQEDLEKTGSMLLAMAEMGVQKGILSELLSFSMGKKLHPDQRRFLAGPMVIHKSEWNELMPAWLPAAIGYDRLKIILEEIKTGQGPGWQIGPIEITAAMYSATMKAPLRYEYAQLYIWASANANARHYKKSLEHMWSIIDGDIVTDEQVLSPKGRFYSQYRDLCLQVRPKIVDLQKKRERGEKKKNKSRDSNQSDAGLQGLQLDLF